mmetsp:Transcript_25104/g.41356  ORF Transcript_25104/g.41356 Transcript_25104/m.41356 type:complete len:262 (+) Transcript_25104:174-959(+)|eukprot:CAMPEP_0184658412 /NCGR_PEP_ID=MMETSP0308-20130426/25248_1 /TAXON_ID=38269 /ORGANISM="Gloeochaete witrockiana, Strain SAG 46.84" /LENGTH=261 /DNA_ID=CAMNT_0027097369 /DNA_START=85 /DNA_END=870 /DNA_ORIENTATION=-
MTDIADKNWSAHARVYETAFAPVLSLYCRDALVLASGTMPDPPATVLDVACGTGAMTIHLARLGFTVTGTDIAQGMLDALSKQSNLNLNLVRSDGQSLDPFADESFDAVTSSFGIALFPNRLAGWNAARRVLKLGGALIATWWSEGSDSLKLFDFLRRSFGMDQWPPHPCGTAAGFRQELEECGFDVVNVFSVRHDFVYPSGKVYSDGIWDNPFFSIMEEHGRDVVNEKIGEYFGKKSVDLFMKEPVVVTGHASVAVAKKK